MFTHNLTTRELAALKKFVIKDPTRAALQDVGYDHDGYFVATDGNALIRISHPPLTPAPIKNARVSAARFGKGKDVLLLEDTGWPQNYSLVIPQYLKWEERSVHIDDEESVSLLMYKLACLKTCINLKYLLPIIPLARLWSVYVEPRKSGKVLLTSGKFLLLIQPFLLRDGIEW